MFSAVMGQMYDTTASDPLPIQLVKVAASNFGHPLDQLKALAKIAFLYIHLFFFPKLYLFIVACFFLFFCYLLIASRNPIMTSVRFFFLFRWKGGNGGEISPKFSNV